MTSHAMAEAHDIISRDRHVQLSQTIATIMINYD